MNYLQNHERHGVVRMRRMTMICKFCLRPNLEIIIELPDDLTAMEADRFSKFILTLPFGCDVLDSFEETCENISRKVSRMERIVEQLHEKVILNQKNEIKKE